MDPSHEEQQLNELLVLESIYAEDYKLIPPPKAWKGAVRGPEFTITVRHSERANIRFDLNVKFPKTYPSKAYPTFTITKPIHGLDNDQVSQLSHAIQGQVQEHRGSEMVFQIVTFCQDWLTTNVKPPVEPLGSLALQMKQRAVDKEKELQILADKQAADEAARQAKAAQELKDLIRAEEQKQQLAKAMQVRARQRAASDATETPFSGDIPTESFDTDIEFRGAHFDAVRYFHPRRVCIGTVYSADPICDDANVSLPLELHVVVFESSYYKTTQGRKKLKLLEEEITRLISVKHPNVLRTLAVKMHNPHSNGTPKLVVLSEQAPPLTLQDVLDDCDTLRDDRASDYLVQALSGLNAIHLSMLVHRGIGLESIFLSPRDKPQTGKLVRLGKAAYWTQLQDLHRSNGFGKDCVNQGTPGSIVRDAWLSKDVKNESLLLYTRQRDIHSVGIVFLQMILGVDVMDRFSDIHSAVMSPSISSHFQRCAMDMLLPKKNTSCLTLLAALAETSFHPSPHSSLQRSPSIPFTAEPRTPHSHAMISGSPDFEYFRMQGPRPSSRWKEDWEELELLGRGAFGSVVKARNKIDSRVYAVKKVRLRAVQSDAKIFREVNALSRLNHRFIVRYYTTWVETSEPTSAAASDEETDSEDDSDESEESGYATEDGMTSVPSRIQSREASSGPVPLFDMDDLDDPMTRHERGSFPSIHFTRSGEGEDDTDSDVDSPFDSLFKDNSGGYPKPGQSGDNGGIITPTPQVQRTLYIQMEFVERQTLKERVEEGISETEAWRLFQQIVDALVHMSTLSILHRDIKLNNIFIDAKGDCKVGDFGLATSSLAAVDPSDVSPRGALQEADMTLEVGTRLYIAPEVQARSRRPTNHAKADMYSLGIVFFEMNYAFSTGSERINVLEKLRMPEIHFPDDWDPAKVNQRQIITSLLQQDPDDRPTALELSQSPLLPSRLEDEYFKGALRMMAKPDSPHYQAVLASLFKQPVRPSLNLVYYTEAEPSEHASLNGLVQEHLTAIFRLRGAIDVEPPLLMTMTEPEEDGEAAFIDKHGEIVRLPTSLLGPLARLAARSGTTRIKRFHIGNAFRAVGPGHPRPHKAAVFDIITPDLAAGPVAAGAEVLAVVDSCLNTFPNLGTRFEVYMSHSTIIDTMLNRVPPPLRNVVVDVMSQTKSTMPQKRSSLLKKGLLRSTIDELDVLSDTYEDLEQVIFRLDKLASPLLAILRPVFDELKNTIKAASIAGASRPVKFLPLMLGPHTKDFKDGLLIEVARRSHRIDLLAVGGRYDNLMSKYAHPGVKTESVYALGLQISFDKLTAAVATYQSSLTTSLKEARSFGYWSPRRCDVYVICYHPGYMQERLELAAYLWRHNISCDVMYESAITSVLDHTALTELCKREGILFTVNPRPKRDQATGVKVTSVFGGDEDVLIPRQELVAHLHDAITTQKRADTSSSGATAFVEGKNVLSVKDSPILDLQTILPPDMGKKGLKRNKTIIQDKAHDLGVKVHKSLASNIPMMVVDLTPACLATMTRSAAWITDDDAWKTVAPHFSSHTYAQQVRDAVAKRQEDGFQFLLLYATREERMTLLQLV
ncbi:Serine/threonine-protein kinase [Cylindrobasidium torrendii FP15055 ss-10]|uniref:non-specific serine/threonine protein kinase n=1 Tax=Cylindrobasidium torrendii FP15055 ss-10 TaxID=1314674 RepID=A0A0D7BCJ5_9AGAR|nr:Serine/threonine-protein kinase [Cylindrobasidium torrendii FP15055 ss-10]